MKVIDRDDSTGVIWLKCFSCKNTYSFLLEKLFQPDQVESEQNEIKNAKVSSNNPNTIKYSPSKIYSLGQILYHPIFDDVGKVVKKSKTTSGTAIILVKFERLGKKELVEGHQL